MMIPFPLKLNDIDERIWAEELEEFVPARVFDVHTHIYRKQFWKALEQQKEGLARIIETWPESNKSLLDKVDSLLMAGRRVHRFSFGMPFRGSCDFEASNKFTAEESAADHHSAALMLVHPEMTAEYIHQKIDEFGFVGLKPYRMYSVTGDVDECRITDFLPEHQIQVVHERGLMIMMHLARRRAIADSENIKDLQSLCATYPDVRWVLAHCGRSYTYWPIEQAAEHIKDLPNIWFDTSSVCETDAFYELFSRIGVERVMYGSDDIPVGVLRGKYITFAHAWGYLNAENNSLDLSHCDGRMTFTRYEQLRGMARAAKMLKLSKEQIEDLFYNTAVNLLDEVKSGR